MQIAGSPCFICGQNVGTMRDGAACLVCEIVVHKTCAESQGCPKCGQHFLRGERVQALPSPAAQIELNRPTSVTVLARLTFLGVPLSVPLVIKGFFLVASAPMAGLLTIVLGAVTGIMSAVLGSAFLRGLEWSRKFYLWGSPLLLVADSAIGSRADFLWWRFSVEVTSYCVWAFVLTRPKAVAFFWSPTR